MKGEIFILISQGSGHSLKWVLSAAGWARGKGTWRCIKAEASETRRWHWRWQVSNARGGRRLQKLGHWEIAPWDGKEKAWEKEGPGTEAAEWRRQEGGRLGTGEGGIMWPKATDPRWALQGVSFLPTSSQKFQADFAFVHQGTKFRILYLNRKMKRSCFFVVYHMENLNHWPTNNKNNMTF